MFDFIWWVAGRGYATDREMLQAEIYAIHPQIQRLDTSKRIQYKTENTTKWPITEAIILHGGLT